ncbi:hypothetical protein D3C72_2482570 [compost metagenome]
MHSRFHAVVGLGDGGCRKGIGLDDIGASHGIFEVDLFNRLGLGQNEQVVIALLGVIGMMPADMARAVSGKILFR